jgi:glycosyltransferase involved in cell wall biosynthesis
MSLLFYDDSPVFGGHEVMALLGLDAVLSEDRGPVRFLAPSANRKLRENLTALARKHPHLEIELLEEHSSKLESLRHLVRPARIRKLARRFREIAPSLVVAIQGNLEHSSLALLAARRAGIPSASYLPVPHTNAAMGARFGAVRDLFCSRLIDLPDTYITISDEMARLLKERGATAPVKIVYNGIDTDRFRPGDTPEACRRLGLPSAKVRIGMVGRIEFRQKQQHLLVEAVAADPTLAGSCHLVFAGEGPDSAALVEILRQSGVSGTVLPWSDPADLYRAMDAMVIPSRYEGLPLVMLEALSSGTPVLGSDRDGMRDVLPAEWRFQPGDAASLGATLVRFLSQGRPRPSADLVGRVRSTMSLPCFRDSFSSTVLGLVPGMNPSLRTS